VIVRIRYSWKWAGSTFNAFATVIASNAAGVPFTDGLLLRAFILFACLAAGILFVVRYAQRVKAEPARSVVAAQREDNIAHFLRGSEIGGFEVAGVMGELKY